MENGMNLGKALVGGAIGYVTGGRGGALAGGLQGAMGANGNTAVGNGANRLIGGMNAASEPDNAALMGENLRHQSAMQ